jgi:hypothetical protein
MTDENLDAKAEEERREKERKEQEALPYSWKQTLMEVDIVVHSLPKGIKSRQVDVEIKKNFIKVGLKGEEPVMRGELSRAIKVEESTWLINDGQLSIHLEKVNKSEWWPNVIATDPAIDTTKIQPENSKLSDLDGETRAMVEKMMFDQRQKAAGKPSSEEMKKMEMLEKFKAQHPEMDFSQMKQSF